MPRPAELLSKYWSSTVSLPKTAFKLRPSPPVQKAGGHKLSDEIKAHELYQWQRSHRPQEKTFILHDGPPYANGDLHIGHAVNKLLKDFICRFELLQGKRIHFVPGFDCHGLPIELKALESFHQPKKARRAASPSTRFAKENRPASEIIRKLARKHAEVTSREQTHQFGAWNIMADWPKSYLTMDVDYKLDQLRVFRSMFQQGLIVSQNKPVFWSPSTETALAEAELVYREDHVSKAIYVKFPVVSENAAQLLGGDAQNISLVIWTTTPWTIPADRAVAVHPDIYYAILHTEKFGSLILAANRVADFLAKVPVGKVEKPPNNISGKRLSETLKYRQPFESSDAPPRPVIMANFVTGDAGTGLVHCAPGHGEDDFQVCKKHKIPAFAPVDDRGCFTAALLQGLGHTATDNSQNAQVKCLTSLIGQPVLGEGQDQVIKFLSEQNLVLGQSEHIHKYPYDWRTNKPVIWRATQQWFIDVTGIQKDAAKALRSVKFSDSSSTEPSPLEKMIQARDMWCISRQRAWGVPIPAIDFQSEGIDPILTVETINLMMVYGILDDEKENRSYTDRGVRRIISQTHENLGFPLDSINDKDFSFGKDTMDVWLDSGTSWTTFQKPEDEYSFQQADVYIEGKDQHRGWFQSSLLTSIAHQRQTLQVVNKNPEIKAPFKSLITHGFILDEKRQKMSKSIGNVISPQAVIEGAFLEPNAKPDKRKEALGLDGLRYWVATVDYTSDISLGPQMLRASNTQLLKIRGTLRFILGNLEDFDRTKDCVERKELEINDRIVLFELSQTTEKIEKLMKSYNFARATTILNDFIATSLSARYFKAIKDRLYIAAPNSLTRRAAQTALMHSYDHLLGFLSPFVPDLVEEAWRVSSTTFDRSSDREHPLHLLFPVPEQSWSINGLLAPQSSFINRAVQAMNTAWAKSTSANLKGGEIQCKAIIRPSCHPEVGDSILVSTCTQGLVQALVPALGVSEVEFLEPGVDYLSTVKTPDWVFDAPMASSTSATGPDEGWFWLVPAEGKKCQRCWMHVVGPPTTPSVEPAVESAVDHNHANSPLCNRCRDVVDGMGLNSNPDDAWLEKWEEQRTSKTT